MKTYTVDSYYYEIYENRKSVNIRFVEEVSVASVNGHPILNGDFVQSQGRIPSYELLTAYRMIWFSSGDSSVKKLKDNKVTVKDGYVHYAKSFLKGYQGYSPILGWNDCRRKIIKEDGFVYVLDKEEVLN